MTANLSSKNETWRCPSADGLSLFYQSWTPDVVRQASRLPEDRRQESALQALVCLVHGVGEHSGRYQHWAERFNQTGIAVVAFDHRGHGQSQGQRGHTPSYDAYLDDIDRLIEQGRQRFPGLPVFLYGHSMGANLVLYYSLKRKPDLNGVIATSPGIRNALEQQKAKVLMVRLLGSILPALAVPSDLEVQGISRDPAVVTAYQNDPLVHGKVSARWGSDGLAALQYLRTHAGEFPLPLLLMHGSKDRLTYAAGSQEFAAQAPGDVTFKLWEGFYHELHNEPEKDAVFAVVQDWIQARLPGERLPA